MTLHTPLSTDAGRTSETKEFRRLQARLAEQFRRVFADDAAPRTVLILPSLSLDQEVMAKISGVINYEERMLCLLLLLRLPRTRVIYVTSQPIPPAIIDYYLHLLPGIPRDHARRRLTLLACHDGSAQPLSAKILARPRLVARIRQAIADPECAHMTCYNVSSLERSLAVILGIPIYGCDPDLLHLASKTGSRRLLREAGLEIPDGYEDLADINQLVEALAALKRQNPGLRRAVVKLNEGFSGEGNAVLSFEGAPEGADLAPWIYKRLPGMAFEARDMTWEAFIAKIGEMGAIAEEFIEGDPKRSPSAQYRIDPLGGLETISTHDQVTGGRSGQIFLGCRFPADRAYRLEIQAAGLEAAKLLKEKGVLGRVGVDFVSVPEGAGWRHYALELNIRKGGTTHPFLTLQFLTDGTYDPATGLYHTGSGRPCYYYASDNLEAPHYVGLTPEDLIDIAVENGLHFHGATQQGVMFHLIGALSEFGKLGVLCVADSEEAAKALYERTIAVLDREGQRAGFD
jgi:PGM1 C-terminal domain